MTTHKYKGYTIEEYEGGRCVIVGIPGNYANLDEAYKAIDKLSK